MAKHPALADIDDLAQVLSGAIGRHASAPGLPILGIPLVHHGAVVEAQELRRPGVWQQQPHHLLIPRKYLQDHPSNPLATGYAEIAQNSFADALMLGPREASVLM